MATSYCLDCAYLVHLIPGTPTKWDQLSSSMRDLAEELQQRWQEFEVYHLIDAGVFGDQSIDAVIDFSMEDQFDRLQFHFCQKGRLPDDAIERWGAPIAA